MWAMLAGAQDRGQPTRFEVGTHGYVFRTSFLSSASMSSITWFLQGQSATAGLATPGIPKCGPPDMYWAGTWQPGSVHMFHDVVAHAGGSWVAEADPGTTEQLTFPSPQTRTFSRSGRRAVADAHVAPTSVVVIQYVGRGGRRPTSVARQRPGGFVAIGSPRRKFRYVVYNQPATD